MFKLISYSQILGRLFLISVFKNHIKTFLTTIYPTQRGAVMKIAFVGMVFLFFAHPTFAKNSDLETNKRALSNHYNEAGEAMIPIKEFCRNFPIAYSEAQIMSGAEIENRCWRASNAKTNEYGDYVSYNALPPDSQIIAQAVMCKYMRSVYDMEDCLKIIVRNNLPPDMIGFCSRIERDSLAIMCLKTIAEKKSSASEIQACRTMLEYDDHILSCLRIIAGKDLNKNEFDICNEMHEDTRGRIKSAPGLKCLKAVAGTNLSEKAAEFCRYMGAYNNLILASYNRVIKCLEIITERNLSEEDIDDCKNREVSYSRKMNCLRSVVADSSRSLSQKKSLGAVISDFFHKIWALF